jgi:hypothetical protein
MRRNIPRETSVPGGVNFETTQDIFDSTTADPMSWWFTARAFREAADVLFHTLPEHDRRPRIYPVDVTQGRLIQSPATRTNVIVFLMANALENMLKAAIVGKHEATRVEVARERKASGTEAELDTPASVPVTHDLKKLCEEAEIELQDDEEKEQMKCLFSAHGSWGRYPCGLSPRRGDIGPDIAFDLERTRHVFGAVFDRADDAATSHIHGDPVC